MVETLLEEIGRRPGQPPGAGGGGGASRPLMGGRTGGIDGVAAGAGGVTSDREGYALAAGLALGLVTLGVGSNAPGLSDIRIRDRLKWVWLAEHMVPMHATTCAMICVSAFWLFVISVLHDSISTHLQPSPCVCSGCALACITHFAYVVASQAHVPDVAQHCQFLLTVSVVCRLGD